MEKFKTGKYDSKVIQPMGNGNVVFYGHGVDFMSVKCPYTSPDLLRLFAIGKVKDDIYSYTSRKPWTGLWEHELYINDHYVSGIFDVLSPYKNAFVRKIQNVKMPFRFHVDLPKFSNGYFVNRYKDMDAYEYEILPGNPIIFDISDKSAFATIILEGNASFEILENVLFINVNGDANIRLVFAKEYADCILDSEYIVSKSFEDIILDDSNYYEKFKSRIKFPEKMDDLLEETIENGIMIIKNQQSAQGGLPSAVNLPVGYSRDDYGPLRAYLNFELFEEAKAIIDFKFSKFKRFGNFINADAMGRDYPRHLGENDKVEQTGYVGLMVRDYFEKTKDNSYIKEILDMLIWIFEVQHEELENGMLPFNGDETYIAGGHLPRSCIHQGASEATLMFIEYSLWLYKWIENNGIVSVISSKIKDVYLAKENYLDNFVINGDYISNNPNRVSDITTLPRFKHGVCEEASRNKILHYRYLEKDDKGHYICGECRANGGYRGDDFPDAKVIPSVCMLPAFLKNSIFTNEMMIGFARKYENQINPKNYIVGYDPALMLYTYATCGGTKKEIENAYNLCMQFRDEIGAWNEYYTDFKPANTSKSRPWETGYSLEALCIAYDKMK